MSNKQSKKKNTSTKVKKSDSNINKNIKQEIAEENKLSRSLNLLYVYAMATGALFTFLCYWDGIFMSYTGPATFVAFTIMTILILPTAFVYSELSTMLPSAGSSLVYNTVGQNKHVGFWSTWLVMCAWIAVPACGVKGLLDWIQFQFELNVSSTTLMLIGILILVVWFLLSLYKNVIAGKVQTIMLFMGMMGVAVCTVMFFFSKTWSFDNFTNFFASSNSKLWGGSFTPVLGWLIGCAFMITPYFGFETVPAMVEEGNFPIKEQKKAILGCIVTNGIINTVFYFALAGVLPWATLTNGGDCHPFIVFEALKASFGSGIGWFILVMGFLGVVMPIATSVLSFWYSAARMIYAMGRQNFLPKAFSKTNRFKQPILPNIVILAVSICFLLIKQATAFFDLMAFACTLCYVITSYSAIVLEKKHPEWVRPYKCSKLIKYLSLIIMIVMAVFCTIGISAETWAGFLGYMALGFILWLYMAFAKWKKEKVVMITPEGEKEY